MSLVLTLGWLTLALPFTLALRFAVDSAREGERRATGVALVAMGGTLAMGVPLLVLEYPARPLLILLAFGGSLTAILALTVRRGSITGRQFTANPPRVDERDALFHRFSRLEPGTPEFDAYYAEHPEQREFDDAVRAMPPMASPGSRTHDPLASPFSSVLDELTGRIAGHDASTGGPIGPPVERDPALLTRHVTGFARFLGADAVGCTTLDPAWVYSHVGRGPGAWGEPIELDHPFAVAIAVEMRWEMMRHAPQLTTMTETTAQYLEAAKIAAALVRYVEHLGYGARAHVDGDYRVMCVPVAADAGLGELGRLGLLITPGYGPRVRLAVVTTDMPLVPDRPTAFGAQDFCDGCLKCSDACPSRSIDPGPRRDHRGVVKWRSEQDSCYRYWRIRGSDCGLCVRVCPYSHPRSPSHDLVRWAIRRNARARRLAVWADDLAYGRRPGSGGTPPGWHG